MGILSFFRKRDPEDIVSSVSLGIVAAVREVPESLVDRTDQKSAEACFEVAYLLLHFVDRELCNSLDPPSREYLFDKISERVIAIALLGGPERKLAGPELEALARQRMDTLNSRQTTYFMCTSVVGENEPDGFPRAGTMVFALCFLIREVLADAVPLDSDDLLAGKGDVSQVDIDNLPDIGALLHAAAFVVDRIKKLRLRENFKKLR